MIILGHIKYQGDLHVVDQINANVKIVAPLGSSLFRPRAIISINLVEIHCRGFILNIKALDPEVCDKKHLLMIILYTFTYDGHMTPRLSHFFVPNP